MVLANPPFSGKLDKDRIVDDVKVGTTTATEILFLKYMMDSLKPGGRCGVIVPEGVLFGSTGAHKELRRQLIENNTVEAVLSLPGGVFQPYSGVKTSVLLFRRAAGPSGSCSSTPTPTATSSTPSTTRRSRPMTCRGWSRRSTAGRTCWDDWQERDESAEWTEKWWFADADAIRANDFNLSASRYRPMSQAQVEHRDPTGAAGRAEGDRAGDPGGAGRAWRSAAGGKPAPGGRGVNRWPTVRLGEIAEIGSGSGFPKEYQGIADEQFPFLKVSDMNLAGNEVHIRAWNNSVSDACSKSAWSKVLSRGSVIFPKIGAAIATNKKRILTRPSCVDNNVMAVTPRSR